MEKNLSACFSLAKSNRHSQENYIKTTESHSDGSIKNSINHSINNCQLHNNNLEIGNIPNEGNAFNYSASNNKSNSYRQGDEILSNESFSNQSNKNKQNPTINYSQPDNIIEFKNVSHEGFLSNVSASRYMNNEIHDSRNANESNLINDKEMIIEKNYPKINVLDESQVCNYSYLSVILIKPID
jgi:hypothetical protein